MNRKIVHSLVLGAAAMTMAPEAMPYAANATVDLHFGGNLGAAPGTLPIPPQFFPPSLSADVMWVAFRQNHLQSIENSTYFTAASGYSGLGYYNSQFMTTESCNALFHSTGLYGEPGLARKYGCRATSSMGNPIFLGTLPYLDGPVGHAAGTLTVTDTALTGVLQVVSSTDEPTGTSTRIAANGMRVSNAAGSGTDGYNYRSNDGTLYGNSWFGITTAATLTVNLTGTFTATEWSINGGTVRFSDPGFACQQSGFGGTDPVGLLCTPGTNAGGLQPDGANLSWGQDPDGAGPSTDTVEIDVIHTQTGEVIQRLAGVLASLSVQNGQLTTNSGEFRRAYSVAGATSCNGNVHYDPVAQRVTCGILVAGRLAMTGSVTVVPLPATAGFMALSLGALTHFVRRRRAGRRQEGPGPS